MDKALSLSSFNTIIYFLKYFETENGNNYSHQKIEELIWLFFKKSLSLFPFFRFLLINKRNL